MEKWKLDLVVATSAFGVGIDNNAVRSVIHVKKLPERLIDIIKQDGLDVMGDYPISIILFDESDIETARNMAIPSYLTEKNAFERWRTMYQRAQNLGNDTLCLIHVWCQPTSSNLITIVIGIYVHLL